MRAALLTTIMFTVSESNSWRRNSSTIEKIVAVIAMVTAAIIAFNAKPLSQY